MPRMRITPIWVRLLIFGFLPLGSAAGCRGGRQTGLFWLRYDCSISDMDTMLLSINPAGSNNKGAFVVILRGVFFD
jgi:hypothetical protein